MGLFKKWKERRVQRRKLQELSDFASRIGTISKLAEKGLLEWNQKLRQLYIDQSLALLMMKDVDSWMNFIKNVFVWQYSKECERAWADYFQKEELAAVRKATKKYASMTREDIERVREARRQEILQSDMEPPKINGFEFFIIAPPDLQHSGDGSAVNAGLSQTEPSPKPTANSPVGQLISVGHYDPETDRMEMALWSDVEHLIKNNTAQ